jgi:hypothetical protein
MKTITHQQAKTIAQKIADFQEEIYAEMHNSANPEVTLRIKTVTVWTENNEEVELSLIVENYGVLSFFNTEKIRIWTQQVYPSRLELVTINDEEWGDFETLLPKKYLP